MKSSILAHDSLRSIYPQKPTFCKLKKSVLKNVLCILTQWLRYTAFAIDLQILLSDPRDAYGLLNTVTNGWTVNYVLYYGGVHKPYFFINYFRHKTSELSFLF